MTIDPFPVGALVRITGSRGRSTVRRRYPEKGEALLWGGTPMHEKFRHVRVDRLRPVKEKASR